MLSISSTYLASGNFLCTFCKTWRREGKQFQVMAFTRRFERRYITSCQNTIKWTMTRLPYMSDYRRASNCTSRIDQKCLKRKAGGEAITPMKRDGRNKAITLLNCNVSQNTSERGDRKQIHSGKIEDPPGLIDRKYPPKRTISKAVKMCPEESLVKRNQRLIRQSEAQRLKTLEKFGKTVKMKSKHKIFGTGDPSDRAKLKLRTRMNVGKNGAIWDGLTADKADKAFVEFHEMLRVPEYAYANRLLHEQDVRKKSKPRPTKKKMLNEFKVSDPHVKHRLRKNKTNVEIYDHTHLLKENEPQCEFAEVQCGRKKLYIALLEDGVPENVTDKLPIKNVALRSKDFPEKLMKMTPATLSKITPEKIFKMIRDSKSGGGKLVKMMHDQPPKGRPGKSRNGGRDGSLQLRIPRKNADLKVVVNLKKPLENVSCPTIHFKKKTPNGIVAKTMKFQVKKMEKYLLLTNNGKIRIRYLTGGLTNIKQRLIERLEISKILKCPVAISGEGRIVMCEKMDDSKSIGSADETSGASLEKPKESLVQKFKLLHLKQEDKSKVNKEAERKYLFRILKRKTRKVANEKVDEGKLIEAQLNNNVSETFSKFDTLLQEMDKPKENLEKDTRTEMKSDRGKENIPAEAGSSKEKKTSLPKQVPRLINKEEAIPEEDILPKPKPKVTLPAWKEIEKINKEKQAQFSKMLPSQLVDPYFLQLQQQKFKQKEMQGQVGNETEPMTVPEQWDPTYQGSTLPTEEQAQKWSQTSQESPMFEETMPSPETQENTHKEVGPLSSNQEDQSQSNQHSHIQGIPAEWTSPAAEAQKTGQTSQTSTDSLEPSKANNSPQSPQNDFYYPELRNQRSRRPNLPPPITEERTTHFVSLLPEPEQSLVPIDVQVPPVFEGREVQMYDTQLEETINKPLIEGMELKDPEILLRENLPDYLPENIINKWDDKNWDVRQNWETRADKVPNLRKLVRANSGNADYVHSFIIESDTLGECYRELRQTPDFTPKTDMEYNFKYDQEPEMRMFENVVAQNFTRVDDPDFIQVKRLRNDKAKMETTVTNVTVIHPEAKIAPEVSTPPQSPIQSPVGLSTKNEAVTNALVTSAAGDSYVYRESTPNQVTGNELNADASIKPVLQRQETLNASHNHITMSGASQVNEAREVIYPERENAEPSPTQDIQSIGFRLGAPEKKFRTVDNVPIQRPESAGGNKAPSEENKGEVTKESNTKTLEKQENVEKHENLKIFASDSGKSTESEEARSPKSTDKPKLKQEGNIAKKSKETLAAIADVSCDSNNKTGEVKWKKTTERVKEETDQKVKEEIMQKLKDELSSKLRNEWKVKLFDELADKIKPVIELKLTSDKPKNQIYLEKAKSEKLEVQREQPQVKDQLKEELRELKEELKKIKMKEELKQELKSELKSEFTSRTGADARALDSEHVRLEPKKVNERYERVDVRGKSESTQMKVDQKVPTVKNVNDKVERDKKLDECGYSQSSVSTMSEWRDGHYGNASMHQAEEKESQPSGSDVQGHGDANPSTPEITKFERTAEKDERNSLQHLPQKEHPYLPRRDNPPLKDQPERQPQLPHTLPNKDHPYLPKWDPIPHRNLPGEPSHPQPQPPNEPRYPHTQPPHHPYQPQPETPNQPYRPYQPYQPQPQPQYPHQPDHPQPQVPSQPFEPQTLPPNQPAQSQTPNYSPYQPRRPIQEASPYENEVYHSCGNQIVLTPAEETNPVQDSQGERYSKEEDQHQKSWEQSGDPPQIQEARTQPFHSLNEEALHQSTQKHFKINLPEPKMEDGKRAEDQAIKAEGVKTKQKEEQDPAKKEEVKAKQKEDQEPVKKKEEVKTKQKEEQDPAKKEEVKAKQKEDQEPVKKKEEVKTKQKEDQEPTKKTEEVKAKQKEEQDLAKKKEDEKIVNQQYRAKFFRGLMPEKQNPEEKPDDKTQKEENQGKKYFRTLLPDQKTPGKFMKFKGDQKKLKGGKKEESEKRKPNKTPGEIKLKELPPTKPEIKKSSDNKPAEILVKSIETIVEQSRKSEMETAKQVEATEQKKLIKQEQEAAVQKELETKKQLEAAVQKELLRQQQEAAAKRDLEMRKLQEEMDRKYKEALEAKRREELARKVPGIAGYGAVMPEHRATPVVHVPPDKKPNDSKDDRFSDEKKIKLPGPESVTEKRSNPEKEGAAKKEVTPTKPPVTSAEKMKSFLNPLKFGTASTSIEKQASEDDKKKQPSPAESSPKKAEDKKEKLSPLQEWERKIIGGSDKSQVDQGKKDNISAKPDTEKAAHDKQKAPEENSKLGDLGKRKSNLSEWEKEIDEQMSSFFGGMRDTAREEKKTKESELAPRKEESTPSDQKPKMCREDDSEVLKARVEQYLNIYDPPKKGGGDSDSGTATMILPNIEQYDRSDMNDIFSAGLKANDFNLYLSREEAEEVLKYSQEKTHQKDSGFDFVTLDQTTSSPSLEGTNLLMGPPSAKSEVNLTPEQESSVHVVKVVFEDKKSGAGIGEENKRRYPDEVNEKELKSFVGLLRSILPSEHREKGKIFLEKEADLKKKLDGEKEASSELELIMQLLKMAMSNSKSEMLQNKSHAKALDDPGNIGVNLQPFLEFLRSAIADAERPRGRIANDGKQDWTENVEAEKGKDRSGSYLDVFRKVVESAGSEVIGKRTLQTGAGDVRGAADADFRSFLQILKEVISKVDKQAHVVQGEQLLKKEQQERFARDLGAVQTSKKHAPIDRVESTKKKTSLDQPESSAARKDTKEGRSKTEDVEHSRKAGTEKTPLVEAQSDDSPEMNVNKREKGKKTKDVVEEGLETSKKTIQVDKIIVNIKADPEEKETSERKRKTSRRMLRKQEEVVSEEEVPEKQEKSTKKKKYRKKKFEEETLPKRKQEFLEVKRRQKLASTSEDDSKKLTKTVPEKEPELEPGSQLMSEIEEEATPVEYSLCQGDYTSRNSLEVREVSPKPKRESFMGEKIVKEFTVREEPFDIEPVSGKSKTALSKTDIQSVEGNIRAARVDKGYMKEGKSGKFPRTILPDSPNVEAGGRSPTEERQGSNEGTPTKPRKKLSKTFFGKEQTKMEEIQKVVKEEASEEEPVKFAEGKRDSKGYAKSPKKNVSGITQKRDLQTLATAMLRNGDENREPNRLIMRKLVAGRIEEDPPAGESVLGDALRHRIASAPYRKTELSYSEKEMSPIKDKTELKTVRVVEEAGEVSPGTHLTEAVAKKANEIPCAVAVDPENLPPPPPVLAGAVLSPTARKPKTKFWWHKMEPVKK